MAYKLDGTKFKAWTDAGVPLVGGALYTYVSGTTTNKATYTDSTLGSANTNPIVLDARGEADVWLGSGAYTFVLKTAAGVTIDTVDGVVDPQAAAESALRADLASSAAGKGAGLIGDADPEGYWNGSTLRAILAEIGQRLVAQPTGKNLLFLAVPPANLAGVLAGTTDIGQYINTFLAGLTTGQNKGHDEYYLPPSDFGTQYKLSTTINSPNSLSQYILRGAGRWATQFAWAGAAGVPMFKAVNAREVFIRDIGFTNETGNMPSHGILFYRDSGNVGPGAPTACSVEGCYIGGSGTDAIGKAIAWECAVGQDSNNDAGYCANNHIHNVQVGYRFGHSNSLAHTIVGGTIANCSVAVFDTYMGDGVTAGGAFSAFGCHTGSSACLLRAGPTLNYTITLFGIQDEGSLAYINTPSSITGTNKLQVNIQGGTFKGVSGSPSITFDGNAGCTLGIYGSYFTGVTTLSCPTAGSRVQIKGGRFNVGTVSFNNSITMEDCYSDAGSPTITNLGSGTLIRYFSSGNQDGAATSISSGTSIDVSTLPSDVVVLNYGSATTLATATRARHGQELTLVAGNANATIQYGNAADQFRTSTGANVVLASGQVVVFKRSGSFWFQTQ